MSMYNLQCTTIIYVPVPSQEIVIYKLSFVAVFYICYSFCCFVYNSGSCFLVWKALHFVMSWTFITCVYHCKWPIFVPGFLCYTEIIFVFAFLVLSLVYLRFSIVCEFCLFMKPIRWSIIVDIKFTIFFENFTLNANNMNFRKTYIRGLGEEVFFFFIKQWNTSIHYWV